IGQPVEDKERQLDVVIIAEILSVVESMTHQPGKFAGGRPVDRGSGPDVCQHAVAQGTARLNGSAAVGRSAGDCTEGHLSLLASTRDAVSPNRDVAYSTNHNSRFGQKPLFAPIAAHGRRLRPTGHFGHGVLMVNV